MAITVFSHPSCSLHQGPREHPERPARVAEVNDQIIRSGLELAISQQDARPAEQHDLLRVHDQQYIQRIFNQDFGPHDSYQWLDPDTIMSPKSLTAALHAAGSGLSAVDKVMQGPGEKAFCNVRPPGHHATRDQAMGFCLFNNIAVAAAYAREKYSLRRLAILDFDVHHGNGTEDIFLSDEDTLFCSSFQHPLYPDTEVHEDSSHLVHVKLPRATAGTAWRDALSKAWWPALDDFKPELILVSAGFDGHAEDELAQLELTDDDYLWIGRQIATKAERHCEGRVVSMLEGGYALSALGRSVVSYLKGQL